MKQLALILSGLCVGALEAGASDRMRDEIICHQIHRSADADAGLTVILRGNETAWVKLLAIYENGLTGPRQVANIQVPLQPEISPASGGQVPQVKVIYRGRSAVLSLNAVCTESYPLTGVGRALLALPKRDQLRVELACTKVS